MGGCSTGPAGSTAISLQLHHSSGAMEISWSLRREVTIRRPSGLSSRAALHLREGAGREVSTRSRSSGEPALFMTAEILRLSAWPSWKVASFSPRGRA